MALTPSPGIAGARRRHHRSGRGMAFGTPATAAPAEGHILQAGGATAVADSYIVVFKDTAVSRAGVTDSARDLAGARRRGGADYQHALRGFEAQLSRRRPAGSPPTRPSSTSSRTAPSRSAATQANPPPGAWTASTSATCRWTAPTPTRAPRRGVTRVHHRHRHPRSRHSEFGGRAVHRATTPSTTTPTPPTATATAPTSPAPSAAPPTAWPRTSSWSPCGCSTAPAAAPTRRSSPASTG